MLSKIVCFFLFILMFITSFFYYPRWNKLRTEATISWDAAGYYWYLPSIFIYKDILHQSFAQEILMKYHCGNEDFDMGTKAENGNYVLKYSSGLAIMMLPFFTIGHIAAGIFHFPQDGFSPPYQFCIQLGGLLVSILGLWFFRKLLLKYYSDKVVAIVLLLLVAGSNYLNYTTIDVGMSHCWLFTIYVFLLLNTANFYNSFKLKYAIRVGLLIGLATLTRPTEIISCLIPLFGGLNGISIRKLKEHFGTLSKNIFKLLIAVFCAFLVVSIQLIYWKCSSGHWLFYSYGNQGFSFLHPHPFLYTFSFRSGWLIYCPMLILAFVGLIPFILEGENKISIILFFIINYYIICSWDIWDYGGRAMIQSYPILFFPFASFIKMILQKRIRIVLISPVLILFLYMNIWITWQYHYGGLYDGQSMNKPYFKRVVGRWRVPETTKVLMDVTDLYENEPKDLKLIYETNFENDTDYFFTSHKLNSTKSIFLTKKNQYTKEFYFYWVKNDEKWLRVQANFLTGQKQYAEYYMSQMVVRLYDTSIIGEHSLIKENRIGVDRLLNNNLARDISIDLRLPDKKFNKVVILFWNQDCAREIYISNIKAWSFKE